MMSTKIENTKTVNIAEVTQIFLIFIVYQFKWRNADIYSKIFSDYYYGNLYGS